MILTADDIEFMERMLERPEEPEEVIKTLLDVDKEFKAVGTLFDIKVVNPVDFTVEQIVEMLRV